MVKVFLANRKTDDEAMLLARANEVRTALHADSPKLDFHITTGKEDFDARIAQAGGWADWTESVVARYDVIVVLGRTVGKATQQILRRAFDIRRPVLLFENGTFVQANAVCEVDRRDFKSGWQLSTGSLQ